MPVKMHDSKVVNYIWTYANEERPPKETFLGIFRVVFVVFV
jgi:hypothetical protein